MKSTLLSVLTLAPAILGAQLPTYRVHHDIIAGRVTSDSGRALAGADIAVTMAPDRTTQFAKTDSAGRYRLDFDRGTGDYLVHVSAVGYQTVRKRVTRTGDDSVFTVDATLKSAVQRLAAMNVQAQRTKPQREQGMFMGPPVGSAEQAAGGVTAIVPPDQRGDLSALAGTLPGVTAVNGGISVLGLPPAQNDVTLGGLSFGGGSVPRAADTRTTVATSTYDATRGGFSGAQVQVMLVPAGPFIRRQASLTLDAPQLQASDAVARRTGMPYTAFDLSAGTTGEAKYNRWFLNSAVEAKRRFSDATSLLGASADVLEHAGVSPDSAQRFLATLSALGVPATTGAVPSSVETDVVSFIGRLDRPMFDYNNYTPLNDTWGLTGYANFTRNAALDLGPTATSAHGGENRQLDVMLQGLYSSYFGAKKDALNETRSGLSVKHTSSTPYVRLPDGRVLVGSAFGDTAAAITSLSFGGNANYDASTTNATWETTNITSLYWGGRATHPGKIYVESRLDDFRQDLAGNRLGSFAFNSLDDLRAGRAASFTRTLDSPVRTGGEWSGAAAATDSWHPSSRFWLLYGARVEANAFTSAPASNPDIASIFGVRNDHAPDTWAVSPRAGFTWVYTAATSGMMYSGLGQFIRAPRGALRGGIGAFRSRLDPALLSGASALTGLPGGARQLTCIGPAAPVPDWSAYAASEGAIPGQCVGGTSTFAQSAPNVQLFDPAYRPPTSWRGNLSWSSGFHEVAYSVDAAYSYNVHQPSVVDLNFGGRQQFALAGEGGRPVYVSPSSIVPSSGAVSVADARRSSAFGDVLEQRSDLRGWARQVSLNVHPDFPFYGARYAASLSYTFTQAQRQTRGFDGATFGDPTVVSWSRSDFVPTHEFVAQLGYSSPWASTTLFGKITSGLPFTPLVAGDVNGDGLSNDRAFVFNPSAVTDTALSHGMQSLLVGSTSTVRDCLERQLGNPAGRNSCEGPWRATLNATIQLGQKVKNALRIPRSAEVTLNLANPLAGLDQLLHGNNLHGWGSPAIPSPFLYYVRGFDSSTKAFRYQVNPRFGDTRPSATSFHTPFRLTLDVSFNLSPNIDQQEINRWLEPGRNGNAGPKLDSAALIKRYRWTVPDWYQELLEQADSLLLSRDQVEALQRARAAYVARMDAHWAAISSYMAKLPDDYDLGDAVKHQTQAQNDAWEMARQEAHATLPKVLTPLQLKLLPGNAGMLFRADKPIKGIRYIRG